MSDPSKPQHARAHSSVALHDDGGTQQQLPYEAYRTPPSCYPSVNCPQNRIIETRHANDRRDCAVSQPLCDRRSRQVGWQDQWSADGEWCQHAYDERISMMQRQRQQQHAVIATDDMQISKRDHIARDIAVAEKEALGRTRCPGRQGKHGSIVRAEKRQACQRNAIGGQSSFNR